MAAKSVRLYVDKNYRYHYLSILGYEPPENQSLETVSATMRSGGIDEDISSDEELTGKEGDQGCPTEGMYFYASTGLWLCVCLHIDEQLRVSKNETIDTRPVTVSDHRNLCDGVFLHCYSQL